MVLVLRAGSEVMSLSSSINSLWHYVIILEASKVLRSVIYVPIESWDAN